MRYLKFYIILFWVLFLLLPSSSVASSNKSSSISRADANASIISKDMSKWNSTASAIVRDEEKIKQQTLETKAQIEADRKHLTSLKVALADKIAREKRELSRLKSVFNGLQVKEGSLRKVLSKHEAEIKDIQATVAVYAKDARRITARSLVTPELPNRLKSLDNLFISSRFPSPADIKSLVNFFFTEMSRSSEIHLYRGKIVNPSGRLEDASILRVGEFTACYKTDDSTGFLRRDLVTGGFAAVPGELSWWIRHKISNYMSGESAVLPMDVSHGAVFAWISQSQGLLSWLESGGPIVWPILFIGLFAIFLVIERLVFFARIRAVSSDKLIEIIDLIKAGDIKTCLSILKENMQVPAYRVIFSVVSCHARDKGLLEDALQEALLKELPSLERFLSTLGVLAAIAPMLGLLGTVSGMINTFQTITLFGNSNPRLMSGGISEALITTELGLSIAIPIMLVHHFLERKVDRIIGQIEDAGMEATNAILSAERDNE